MAPTRILVVEDNPEQARTLKNELERLGYTVLGPAPDCSSALELIWQERPDLALVDAYLGSETCEVVLDECAEQHVPVVVTVPGDAVLPPFCASYDRLIGQPSPQALRSALQGHVR